MIISDAGRAIIMQNEGLRLEAYNCPAGVCTIGYGHTGDVKPGDKITQHQAEVIFEVDLQRVEAEVSRLAPKATGPQFSALCSFVFNFGTQALAGSTLLRKLNAGQPLSAAQEFDKWVHAKVNGELVVLPGLVKRRAQEKALFLQGES